MIYSPAHGDMAFTVPLFDEFMRRVMPTVVRISVSLFVTQMKKSPPNAAQIHALIRGLFGNHPIQSFALLVGNDGVLTRA
ncbi:MAG: hypothetical protein WB696_07870 [Chthoniobacterales bacterium]